MGEDKNLCHYFIFVIKNKKKDAHYKYTNKTNSALFSGTIDIFSRSIQEIEWTNIKIKHYIDWFLLKPLYYSYFFIFVFCCFRMTEFVMLLSACFLFGYGFVSRDNLQIKCTFVLGAPPTQQDFWSYIFNMLNIYYSWSGGAPKFFRADSVTLNTPHTTGKSDKIIFRSTKIIGTLPRIIKRGEMVPKSARLSCGVYPA